jgi:hypothetical protein
MHQPITAISALALALTGLAPAAAWATGSRMPVRIVHVSGRSAFDWADAGIGAAAGAGITLLGLGGALAVSQRQTYPTAGPRRPGSGPGSSSRPTQPTDQRPESQ